MNTNSTGAKKQPKAVRLTRQQSQALANLAAMTDEAQQWCLGTLAAIAKAHPRQEQQLRPQLRLVVGGAA